MSLTIDEIKEKNKKLKKDLEDLLHVYRKETGIIVEGNINYGYTDETHKNYVTLKFNNPF